MSVKKELILMVYRIPYTIKPYMDKTNIAAASAIEIWTR